MRWPAALAILCTAIASPARAETVLVVPSPGETSESRRALESRGFQVAMAPRPRDRKAAGATSDRARSSKIDADLEAAQGAYLEQRWKDMLDGLDAIESDALGLEDPGPVLWQVMFLRGVAFRARGRRFRKQMRQAFSSAIHIDPERRPPKGVFGPDVATAFGRGLALESRRPPQALSVTTRPGDARITIGGKVTQPGSIRLSPGLHLVSVSAPGYATQHRLVEVPGELDVKLPRDGRAPGVQLATALESGALAEPTPSARALLRRAARARGATRALVVGPRRTWLVDAQGNASRAQGSPGAAIGKLLDRRRATLLGPTRKQSTPITSRWWFWTSGAAVVVGTAATVFLLTRNRGDGMTVDPQDPPDPPDPGPGNINIGVIPP